MSISFQTQILSILKIQGALYWKLQVSLSYDYKPFCNAPVLDLIYLGMFIYIQDLDTQSLFIRTAHVIYFEPDKYFCRIKVCLQIVPGKEKA